MGLTNIISEVLGALSPVQGHIHLLPEVLHIDPASHVFLLKEVLFSSCVFIEDRTRIHLQNDHFPAHLVSLGHLTVHNVVVRVEDKVDYALEINESDDATAGVWV